MVKTSLVKTRVKTGKLRLVTFIPVIFLMTFTLLFSGCGAGSVHVPDKRERVTYPIKVKLSERQLKKRFKAQLRAWEGVPYRYGGLSKKGVDCSGFVFLTFKERLGVVLPRSAGNMARVGKDVLRKRTSVGDLVFFKTGKKGKTHHVGIYIGGSKFIHASTSNGVMVSSLSNPYWKGHYWKSKRVIYN